MIPALPLDVAQQEEMPHGEGRRSQVAATHDERERPGHRHDEHDGHDRHDGHDAGEQTFCRNIALLTIKLGYSWRSVFQTESSGKGLMLQTALVTQTALVHAQESRAERDY